ncbi:MAG: tetraacyldisaccharide 4'-kinase [Bacteroidetes bacterium]|nr:tetraacyldisaccharide 4'-kinase [Bacteroidota bacterium]
MTLRRIFGAPFAWLFGIVVWCRNWMFDRGWLPVARAAVPVISVGNLAAGGTGKTPFVEWTARFLRQQGVKVGILSRGYGRATTGFRVVLAGATLDVDPVSVGDEPAQLAGTFAEEASAGPSVVIAVDEDRVRGAERLVRDHSVDVIVLDDGFQHRRLARDLDIVLLTADELMRGDALLPAGNRRESMRALRRAGALVVTRCATAEVFDAARRRIDGTAAPLFGVRTEVHAIRRAAPPAVCELGKLAREKALLVSGIGDPGSFESTVRGLGVAIAGHERFGDHHHYDDRDIDRVEAAFASRGASVVLTTQKDLVRMSGDRAGRMLQDLPVYVVVIRQEFVTEAAALERMLSKIAVRR